MQDEVNEKTVSLCVNGGKISARILKAAMQKALAKMEQEKRNGKQKKMEKQAVQKAEKGAAKSHGKQSMEKLMNQGCQLSNIEVTDGNIKSFEKCARKYSIDFSLKKTHPSPRPVILYFSRQRMWMS